jgi:hypothetical protein
MQALLDFRSLQVLEWLAVAQDTDTFETMTATRHLQSFSIA